MSKDCVGCKYDDKSIEGICSESKAKDGLPIRCVGPWSKEKHFYIGKYMGIFTQGMKNNWKLNYIDLFSGPGKCRTRDTGEEIEGSPILSLELKHPFNKYFFVDKNPKAIQTLSKRCKNYKYYDRINFIEDDCNSAINKIVNNILDDSLSLAFIDPTGLNVEYAMLEKLAQKRVDIIITFPEGMGLKRNAKQALKTEESIIDKMFGDKKWRDLKTHDEHSAYYRKRIQELGYKVVKSGDMLRSQSRNLPLYYLIFASKHTKGGEFWDKIHKIKYNGQRSLNFDNI